MCGICGIFVKGPTSSAGEWEKACHHMGEALVHRGPDASGIWKDASGRIFFEHRRLAIIDLSPSGRQPFFNETGSCVCMVNGEIYNHQELKVLLMEKGHLFRSRCDVETVVHQYEAGGIRSWEKLRGMFAVALYDSGAGCLHLARDPLGIKPLYLYEDDRMFAFASELGALRTLPGFSEAWDGEGLSEFLLLGSVSSPRSVFKKIRALNPGEIISLHGWGEISSIGVSPIPDWSGRRVEKVDLESVKACIRDSVRKHLVSDVPIGLFLSGGIDSGTLAGIASEVSSSEVHTLAVTLPGDALDEGAYARETAAHYRTRHQEVPLDQPDFEKDFDDFFEHLDQPSIDGFNTYIVSKAARRAGLTVALSGVGGDELFGGYNTFRMIPRLRRIHRFLSLGGSLGRAAGAIGLNHLGRGSAGARIADYLKEETMDLPHAYLACRGLFSAPMLRKLLNPELHSALDGARRRYFESTAWAGKGSKNPEAVLVGGLEITRYMTTQLLRDTDVMSMAHSLEVRTPLVDVEVVRNCLPYLGMDQGGDGFPKWLLRQALDRPLPDRVVQRAKQGFVFPWQKWLQGFVLKDFDRRLEERGTWDRFLKRESLKWWREAYVRGWAHWSCFWALYVLLRWIGKKE